MVILGHGLRRHLVSAHEVKFDYFKVVVYFELSKISPILLGNSSYSNPYY